MDRYEIKFVLNQPALARVQYWITSVAGFRARHPARTINSLYYDTPDLLSARENLHGISDRRKYRLRWYDGNSESEAEQPYFEIKIRSGRINRKIRAPLGPSIRAMIYRRCNHAELRSALLREIESDTQLILANSCLPALQIAYHRMYYQAEGDIRITLDKAIRYHLAPMYGPLYSGHGIAYGVSVLELKFSPEQFAEASALVRSIGITPRRHSKYVAGLAAFRQLNYF